MSQDFENLINASISSGYFTFKSEKNWTQLDTSKYNELFSVDVKNLSMLYNCIPFNQYVEVEDEYFSKDQLTSFTSTAEHAKREYEIDLLQKKKSIPLKIIEESTCDGSIEEELDFLLSLKEPVKKNLSGNIAVNPLKFGTNESKMKSHSKTSKSIDLEMWLDSVLDD